MLTAYELPAEGIVTNEFEVKRSRFITWVGRAMSEAEARELVQAAREAYPDARHHCSAFVVHVDEALPIERSSDDGEPSGTAGRPMLEVLKGSGMLDVAAVVIRYFGGIKLGTGGLVSAYTDSVSQALAKVPRRTRALRELATVELPHADAGRIEAELRGAGIDIVGVEYDARARYTLGFAPGQRQLIDAHLAAATQGQGEAKAAGHQWVELAR